MPKGTLSHRERKNPAARDAWMKAKKIGRPKQFFERDERDVGLYIREPKNVSDSQ
jgi:hypothetical protein